MSRPDTEAEWDFTQPYRQFMTMILVLTLVGVGAVLAFPRVAPVFLANPWFNAFIALVFVIGVVACFWQIFQLVSSVSWIEGFAQGRPGHELVKAPRLLAPLAALLRKKSAGSQIGASSSRSILDSVATRIDEARDITRYIINLLIFLGLLGTFYGLATTVPAVVDTIRALAPAEGESGVTVFERLISGLEDQLEGMGIAFASSLLGLAGSLVVGILELFASHGQNRFFRELEEWLSSMTRVGFAGEEGAGGEEGSLSQLVEHLAEQMNQLQTAYAETTEQRVADSKQLERVVDAIGALNENLGERDLEWNSEAQDRLVAALEGLVREGASGFDAESRRRLRSMDIQVLRILEEVSAGRQESMGALRADLAELTKEIRALGQHGQDGP
ncbi:MAG: biopolymer transporter ExbB [Boseongicola sp. SB0665_bin_10]|nr:biopolymer transporter ExbB [Boseongicola sp. SB0665_bin_10]